MSRKLRVIPNRPSITARFNSSRFFENAFLSGYEADRAKRLGISRKIVLSEGQKAQRTLSRAAKDKKKARRKMATLARRAGRK